MIGNSKRMSNDKNFSSSHEIITEIRNGKMIILMDDAKRENEGDLLIASDFISPEAINFMITHGRGLVCLTLTQDRCSKLRLPLMIKNNKSKYCTNFTQSIEAAYGITTGISAYDRCHTIKVAVNKNTNYLDLVKPGHIFPVRSALGGVLERSGHTEAGCDITLLAGLNPYAVICEILHEDGTVAKLPYLLDFSNKYGIKIGTINNLIKHRIRNESIIEKIDESYLEIHNVVFNVVLYYEKINQSFHIIFLPKNLLYSQKIQLYINSKSSVVEIINNSDSKTYSNSFSYIMRSLLNYDNSICIFMNCSIFSVMHIFNSVKDKNSSDKIKNIYNIENNYTFVHELSYSILNDLNIHDIELITNTDDIYKLDDI